MHVKPHSDFFFFENFVFLCRKKNNFFLNRMELILCKTPVYGHASRTVMNIYVFSLSFKIDDWLKFLQKTYLANGFVDPMGIYSWASICFLCFLCEVHSYPLRK